MMASQPYVHLEPSPRVAISKPRDLSGGAATPSKISMKLVLTWPTFVLMMLSSCDDVSVIAYSRCIYVSAPTSKHLFVQINLSE